MSIAERLLLIAAKPTGELRCALPSSPESSTFAFGTWLSQRAERERAPAAYDLGRSRPTAVVTTTLTGEREPAEFCRHQFCRGRWRNTSLESSPPLKRGSL